MVVYQCIIHFSYFYNNFITFIVIEILRNIKWFYSTQLKNNFEFYWSCWCDTHKSKINFICRILFISFLLLLHLSPLFPFFSLFSLSLSPHPQVRRQGKNDWLLSRKLNTTHCHRRQGVSHKKMSRQPCWVLHQRHHAQPLSIAHGNFKQTILALLSSKASNMLWVVVSVQLMDSFAQCRNLQHNTKKFSFLY